MRSLVPVWHFWNTSGHLFTWLVCGSFQWRHGILFINCIMWDDKDKVIGFKISHWIHLGWWSTGSPKLNCFNYYSTHMSPIVDWYLLQLTFHEIWTLKHKTQVSEGSWDKILHSMSRTVFFEGRNTFFPVICLSKPYTKILEVVFATSL